MNKRITIHDKESGETFTLEYTVSALEIMESWGFRMEDIDSVITTRTMQLWRGAFIANHPTLGKKRVEELLQNLGNKKHLLESLAQMYVDVLMSITGADEKDDKEKEDEGKNVEWETSW